MIAIIRLERGMSSNGESSACPGYVPVICTHRPSLLPIGNRLEYQGGGSASLGVKPRRHSRELVQ